ncbi:hypothetical protein D1872_241450 [compost metagenome]
MLLMHIGQKALDSARPFQRGGNAEQFMGIQRSADSRPLHRGNDIHDAAEGRITFEPVDGKGFLRGLQQPLYILQAGHGRQFLRRFPAHWSLRILHQLLYNFWIFHCF